MLTSHSSNSNVELAIRLLRRRNVPASQTRAKITPQYVSETRKFHLRHGHSCVVGVVGVTTEQRHQAYTHRNADDTDRATAMTLRS